MRSIQFDELDAQRLFLPEFENTILRCGQDEVGSAKRKTVSLLSTLGKGVGETTHFVTAIWDR
jgi:hypothetical protein